jgi:hypothetical protein
VNTSAKNNCTTTPVQPNGCFKCRETGNYANNCPKRNSQTPQKSNNQRVDQNTPIHNNTQGKSYQNQNKGRVNHITAESAQNAPNVALGTYLINSIPTIVLFYSGASHSFINESFMEKHNILKYPHKKMLHISSPIGEMKATHSCLHVNLKIQGIDFLVYLVVLGSNGIDVILGCDWLKSCDGVIQCAKGPIMLTSLQGERIQVSVDMSIDAGETIINHPRKYQGSV